jgi:ribosomal protein S18 acetylase RimI-like enzyme
MRIEPYTPERLDAVVQLSLIAWAPVFDSIEDTLDPEVYRAFYPDGWRISQQKAVEDACNNREMHIWVAVSGDRVMGFVAVRLHDETMGEIYMIAVHPDAQRRGFASALTTFATEWMKEQGTSVVMVETGGDPGHAPARRTYEKNGFRLLPVARYFKKI